jgi:hypothetical protein
MISNSDLISMVLGTLLPWLTGLVTRTTAHPKVKGATLFALSAASAALTALGAALATGQEFDWRSTVFSALATFVVGQALHSGVYRHLAQYQTVGATGGFIGGTTIPAVVPTPSK